MLLKSVLYWLYNLDSRSGLSFTFMWNQFLTDLV